MVPPGRRRAGAATGLFVIGLLALQALWVVAIPPFDGTDEMDHTYRALMLADGDVLDRSPLVAPTVGHGQPIQVRGDMVRAAAAACATFVRSSDRTYDPDGDLVQCSPRGPGHDGRVLFSSSAASYNPVGYLVPSAASRIGHGTTTLYAMRIASALRCVLVWVIAFWALARYGRTRWPAIGLLTVLTPTTAALGSMVNPDGQNLALAVGLWVVLLLRWAPDPPSPRTKSSVLLGLAGIGGMLLPQTHSLGVVWLPAIVLGAIVASGPRRVLAHVRASRIAHVVTFAALCVGWLLGVAWILLARTNDPSTSRTTSTGAAFPRVLLGLVLWPLQAIGAVPSHLEPSPAPTMAIWLVLLGAVLVGTLGAAGRRARRTSAVALVAGAVLPILPTVLTYRRLGLAWQGRYGYPALAGSVLIPVFAADRHGAPVPRWLQPALVATAVATGQAIAIGGVVHAKSADAVWRTVPHWGYPPDLVIAVVAVLIAAAWTGAITLCGAPRGERP